MVATKPAVPKNPKAMVPLSRPVAEISGAKAWNPSNCQYATPKNAAVRKAANTAIDFADLAVE